MTLFLASVAGPDEAKIAVERGADIVDLKDSSRGVLGALTPETVSAAVAAVAGRRPTSAVTGDLAMEPKLLVDAVAAMAETGVDYVKVGLFPGARRPDCIRALSPLRQRTKLVGVMFADDGADNALVAVMAGAGFAATMLDTARKSGGRLLDRMGISALKDFIGECRAHGLMAGLAGSLESPDIPRLLLLAPDYLGFRRALCAGQDRAGPIDPQEIDVIRGLIPLDPRSPAHHDSPKVDYRLLAARAYSIDQATEGAPTDRIFVHDFVLPVRVGAYAKERDEPQDVRFNVEVEVLRSGHAAEDMRDVFSYDVVTDGIRMIVAHTHIPLVETLAERIAALLLSHDRVVKVRVRVEKLNVGPGGVGVEIEREGRAEVAKVHHLYPTALRDTDQKAAD